MYLYRLIVSSSLSRLATRKHWGKIFIYYAYFTLLTVYRSIFILRWFNTGIWLLSIFILSSRNRVPIVTKKGGTEDHHIWIWCTPLSWGKYLQCPMSSLHENENVGGCCSWVLAAFLTPRSAKKLLITVWYVDRRMLDPGHRRRRWLRFTVHEEVWKTQRGKVQQGRDLLDSSICQLSKRAGHVDHILTWHIALAHR